ncbi:hypothetical protein CRENBAI_011479 [Crenichthys baileyi]|uniref:Uncharacterized protein n=1 Tax=Crenichthys baileyi TaxID=28760 RepID=A0AAV9RMC2_9TELE
MLCVEASPTISSRYLSTSRTSSGSFPPSEVTFHIPRASLSIRGSVVGPLGDGLASLVQAWPARSNPATRRSPTSPDPRPGSRVGPWLCRTRRCHMPRFNGRHEGFLNRSLSDPSPRACLPWEHLPGAFKPQTT